MTRGSPTITIRLPPALKADVEALAARDGVTVTSLVVRALWAVVAEMSEAERRGAWGVGCLTFSS